MSDESQGFIAGLIIGLIAAMLTWVMCSVQWRNESIQRGYAEYNQTTGKWQWKEVVK